MADLTTLDPQPGTHASPTLTSLLNDRLDPKAILNSVVRSVAGVIGAALATVDGRSVAHSDHLQNDPRLAAMIAATMGLGGQLIGAVGGSTLDEVTVRSDTGYVIVYAVGTEAVLTVMARPSTNLHHIKTEVSARLDTLRSAVKGGR